MSLSLMKTVCMATALATLATPAAHANRYSIEDLGVHVIPFDINGSGAVVGFRNDKAVGFRNGHWHALPIGGRPGIALAVNERGDAVGSQGSLPILWARFGQRQELAMPDGATSGRAADISFDRTTTGHYVFGDDIFHTHCFRTLADGSATDLGMLAQGNDCAPHGINDRGEIVGEANVVRDGPVHAFLWREGAMRDLGTLGAGDMAMAFGVNAQGHVVGRSDLAPHGPGHAFVWKEGVMKDLGRSTAFSETEANAINDRGEIVGDGIRVEDGGFRAVRFGDGEVFALEDEVQDLGDWLLISATSINRDGVILGEAVKLGDGQVHAFLLRPVP